MKTLKIDKEFTNIIPSLADDELSQLEENLKMDGWRKNESIVIWNGFIVDGHTRYELCKKMDLEFKITERAFKDRNEALVWIIDNQSGRRNLPDFARVRLALKKEEILKPLAKESQKRKQGVVGQKSAQQYEIAKTRTKIAKDAKISHDTVSKVKYIVKKADKKTKDKLDKGDKELSINKVYRDLKKAEKREKIRKTFKEIPFPKGRKKYNIIYADPPWSFKHYSDKGKGKSPDNYYKCFDIEYIKNMPIRELTAENCILFLWVTYPFLEKCFEVIKAWGFQYKTVGFTWVKKNKKSEGWFWGMGYWTRSNAEICLIATKGSIVRQSNSVSQIVISPIEEHSKKPDIVREKITQLVGTLPRIELFARKKTKGWDVWGNEIQK